MMWVYQHISLIFWMYQNEHSHANTQRRQSGTFDPHCYWRKPTIYRTYKTFPSMWLDPINGALPIKKSQRIYLFGCNIHQIFRDFNNNYIWKFIRHTSKGFLCSDPVQKSLSRLLTTKADKTVEKWIVLWTFEWVWTNCLFWYHYNSVHMMNWTDKFVCLWGVYRPTRDFSLIWRSHHCRWRAVHFHLCSAFMAME